MVLDKAPVPITELAEKWDRPIRDIILWISKGKLKAVFRYEGDIIIPASSGEASTYESCSDLVVPRKKDIEYLCTEDRVTLKCFTRIKDVDILVKPAYRPTEDSVPEAGGLVITLDKLVVMIEEVERMEEDHPELTKKYENQDDLYDILDPDHPWYSKNLDMAVRCWNELYRRRRGVKNDNDYKPSGGHTKLIGDWLKKENPDIGPTTEEHFRVVINPSKRGGPGKM